MALRAVNTVIIATRKTWAKTIYILSWCRHLIGRCWKYCNCHIYSRRCQFPISTVPLLFSMPMATAFDSSENDDWLCRTMSGWKCLKGENENGCVAQVCLTLHKKPMASPSFSSKSCLFVQSHSNCGLDEKTNQRAPNHDRLKAICRFMLCSRHKY